MRSAPSIQHAEGRGESEPCEAMPMNERAIRPRIRGAVSRPARVFVECG
jgi:hypothetical protein